MDPVLASSSSPSPSPSPAASPSNSRKPPPTPTTTTEGPPASSLSTGPAALPNPSPTLASTPKPAPAQFRQAQPQRAQQQAPQVHARPISLSAPAFAPRLPPSSAPAPAPPASAPPAPTSAPAAPAPAHAPVPAPLPPATSSAPLPSIASSNVPASAPLERGGQVHIIWDFEDLPSPTDLSPVYVSQRIISLAETYGFVNTFKCMCKENRLPGKIKRDLQDCGVEIEEIHSQKKEKPADVYILTRILRIVLSTQLTTQQQQQQQQTIYTLRPILMLISGDADFARALSILRRSGAFSDVILLHGTDSADALIHSATIAIEFLSFLYGRKSEPSTLPSIITSTSPHIQPAAVATEEAPPLINVPVPGTVTPIITKDIPPPPLQPQPMRMTPPASTTTSPTSTSIFPAPQMTRSGYDEPWAHDLTHDMSNLQLPSSEWEKPIPSVASGIAELLGEDVHFETPARSSQTTPVSWEHDEEMMERSRASSAPNSARYGRSAYYSPISPKHHRAGSMPSLSSISSFDVSSQRNPTPLDISQRASYDTLSQRSMDITQQQRLERITARHRNCLLVFHRVIQYCEQERIIPRESVLKKRLLDSKIGADLDFDEFISVVAESGEAMIEGDAPQRIIWPKTGRFACADFYCPTDRLSPEQTQEVLDFLIKHRPEVDRGRFGYSQYLARHGPKITQQMPHGVLVELVQLLLNKKYLLFRKGKISVAPNIEQLVATHGNTFSFTTPSGAGITANTVNPYYGTTGTTGPQQYPASSYGYGTTSTSTSQSQSQSQAIQGLNMSAFATPSTSAPVTPRQQPYGSSGYSTTVTTTPTTTTPPSGYGYSPFGMTSSSAASTPFGSGYNTPTSTTTTPERPSHPPIVRNISMQENISTSRMAAFAGAKPFTPATASTLTSTSTAMTSSLPSISSVISRPRRASSQEPYGSNIMQGLEFNIPTPSPDIYSHDPPPPQQHPPSQQPAHVGSSHHDIHLHSHPHEPIAPGIIDMHAADRLARACADAKRDETYGEHMPVYHYEQTVGLSSEPLWVAFCTISLRLCHQTNIGKLKHFKSTMQARRDIAKQEAAQKALDSCAFTLALNTAITDTCKIARQRFNLTSDAPPSPHSMTTDIISRAMNQPSRPVSTSPTGEDDDSHNGHLMDAVADLDRLLAMSNLPPMIYVMESTILSHMSSRSARTVWKCTGEIEVGMSCAPIKWSASQARKVDSKAHVAMQLLKRIIHKANVTGGGGLNMGNATTSSARIITSQDMPRHPSREVSPHISPSTSPPQYETRYRTIATSHSTDNLSHPSPTLVSRPHSSMSMPSPSILPRMYQPEDEMSRIHHVMSQITTTSPYHGGIPSPSLAPYIANISPVSMGISQQHVPTPPMLPRVPSRTVLQALPTAPPQTQSQHHSQSHQQSHPYPGSPQVQLPVTGVPSPLPPIMTSPSPVPSPLPSPPTLTMGMSWPLTRHPSDSSHDSIPPPHPPPHPRRVSSLNTISSAFTWGVDPMTTWRETLPTPLPTRDNTPTHTPRSGLHHTSIMDINRNSSSSTSSLLFPNEQTLFPSPSPSPQTSPNNTPPNEEKISPPISRLTSPLPMELFPPSYPSSTQVSPTHSVHVRASSSPTNIFHNITSPRTNDTIVSSSSSPSFNIPIPQSSSPSFNIPIPQQPTTQDEKCVGPPSYRLTTTTIETNKGGA